jgi:hypothetical protein
MDVQLATATGTVPIILLSETEKKLRLLHFPIEDGNDPAIEFSKMSNLTRFVQSPMSEGRLPPKVLVPSSKLIIFLLLLQPTPVHRHSSTLENHET